MTEKEIWFVNQCKAKGISAENIKVFGEYATNDNGDFLYSVKHEDGSLTMNCVPAKELTPHQLEEYVFEKEDYRACWLCNLKSNLEEGYKEGDEILQSRSWWDRDDITLCFKEAVCRNKDLRDYYRADYRNEPTYDVFNPIDLPDESDIDTGVFLGLRDINDKEEHLDEYGGTYEYVFHSSSLDNEVGYRFATKVLNVDNFIEVCSNIQSDDQYGPFHMLAELESTVEKTWRNEGKVRSSICVKQTADEFIEFQFSHFESECEPDEKFNTIYAVYGEKFDV